MAMRFLPNRSMESHREPYLCSTTDASPTAVKKYGEDWGRHPVGTGPFTYSVKTPLETPRREVAHAVQRVLARDLLWCNMTDSPYFQAYRDYVKGYHFMNQVYVFWETTWLEKA
jgi:hypothetical protein